MSMVYKLVSLTIDIFVNLKSTLLIVDLKSTKAWNLVLQVRINYIIDIFILTK